MNLHEKLIEIRKVADYLQKEKEGHQYNYVSSSQVLAKVVGKMNELNVLLIPRITGHAVFPKIVEANNKTTITYFTELEMEYTWVDADNVKDTIVCPWYGQGVDIEGEKGVGKALTYSEKYFLLKSFNIATDKDDPDAFQSKEGLNKKEPAPKEPIPKDPIKELKSQLLKLMDGKKITKANQPKFYKWFKEMEGEDEEHLKRFIDNFDGYVDAYKQHLKEGK